MKADVLIPYAPGGRTRLGEERRVSPRRIAHSYVLFHRSACSLEKERLIDDNIAPVSHLGLSKENHLRLRELEVHVHRSVHPCGTGKTLACLLRLANAAIELAEAEVAVGYKRTHPQLPCQRNRSIIVLPSVFLARRIGVCGNLTEEAKDPGLAAALLLPACQDQRSPSDINGVVYAAGH